MEPTQQIDPNDPKHTIQIDMIDYHSDQFAQALKEYVEKNKMTKVELARQLGLAPHTVHAIMKHNFRPSFKTIVLIVKNTQMKFEDMIR